MENGSKRQYDEFAEECERLAREAKTDQHRIVLKEMAAAWRKLAQAATGQDG